MLKKGINQILAASVIALGTFAALFWNVLTYGMPLPIQAYDLAVATRTVVGIHSPVRIIVSGIALDAEIEKVALVKESTGAPVRIIVSSIALDAEIKKVALTTDGSMDVPQDPLDAGWYELGPRPGETGSAVIDGHVNWSYGSTGVFADLHKLKPDDLVTVQDDTGKYIHFVVREIRNYDAAADATDIFSSNDGNAHLNLITCSGAWDRSAGQYSERLVVFTELLSAHY